MTKPVLAWGRPAHEPCASGQGPERAPLRWEAGARAAPESLLIKPLPVTRYDPASPDFAREEYPFYWLARVYRAYTLEMEKALKPVGLDVPTWRTLMVLNEQGPSSMSDIALHVVAKLPTITKTVYRVEQEGLVQTYTSTQDARVTMVSITEAGQKALERSLLATHHIASHSFEGMTPGQVKRLNESLRVILDNLSPRHGQAAGAGLRDASGTGKR